MRSNILLWSILLSAGIALDACSGVQVTPTPATATAPGLRLIDSTKVQNKVAVSFVSRSYEPTSILVYAMGNQEKKRPICKVKAKNYVAGGPAADSKGDLWIAQWAYDNNYYLQSTILEYGPNCGPVVKTLQDSYAAAANVAVGPDGTIYVANVLIDTSEAGDVLVYAKGQTKPTQTLGERNGVEFVGVAADTKKDVFATYYDCDSCIGAGLLMFKNGEGGGIPIQDSSLQAPGVPTTDRNDDVLVPDDATLHFYAPPYLVAPKVYALKGESSQCSLNRAETDIACADWQNDSVDVYAYPSMKYRYSFAKGFEGEVSGITQAPD